MLVTVYVHWYDQTIISKAEYEKMMADKEVEIRTDQHAFWEWLDDHYAACDIWDMDENRKSRILKDWERQAREDAEEYLSDEGWTDYEIEV